MFKGSKKYLYIFIILFIIIVGFQYLLPKPISWLRTYLNKDKAPFGCLAIYKLLNGVYAEKVIVNNQTLYNLKDKLDSSASILLINEYFNFNKSDISSLNKIVAGGNSVFISATDFNGPLADTFHLRTRKDFYNFGLSPDSLMLKQGDTIHLVAKNYLQLPFVYSQIGSISSFSNFDSTKFQILAITQQNKACLISTSIGKGKLYLMSAPDIFGNYFIVNHKNKELAYTLLSVLKNKTFIWDEYYKTYNEKNESFLKLIFESDSLYAAYLLLIFTIIVYMITEGRRRQRAIPVIDPVTNTTLEFINVISHVYYNSKNHQSIALEKIKYFYETIRTKFHVNTNQINETLINEISVLSGIEFKIINQLFNYCEKIKTIHEISEYDLIELNRQITNFNKNSQR